jgi:hypothetical protein
MSAQHPALCGHEPGSTSARALTATYGALAPRSQLSCPGRRALAPVLPALNPLLADVLELCHAALPYPAALHGRACACAISFPTPLPAHPGGSTEPAEDAPKAASRRRRRSSDAGEGGDDGAQGDGAGGGADDDGDDDDGGGDADGDAGGSARRRSKRPRGRPVGSTKPPALSAADRTSAVVLRPPVDLGALPQACRDPGDVRALVAGWMFGKGCTCRGKRRPSLVSVVVFALSSRQGW